MQSPTHPGRSAIQNAKAIHNLENFCFQYTIHAELCYIEILLLILLIWQTHNFFQTGLVNIACSEIIASIFRRIFLGHGFVDGNKVRLTLSYKTRL